MKPKILPVLYFAILATECLAILTETSVLHLVSKPLLMPALAIYLFTLAANSDRSMPLLLGALAFSWLGDVVLMLDKMCGSLFIYGLIAFSIAHIFYIFYFVRLRKTAGTAPGGISSALLTGAYMTAFYIYLYPHLGGLGIPVLIYAAVISLMLISSFRAFDLRTQAFGRISVAGTLIFALSDSMLAYNRFVSPFKYAPLAIMLTYGIAQFLIVEGAQNKRPAPTKERAFS
jgi:uncharacterized membrane protein YhhN